MREGRSIDSQNYAENKNDSRDNILYDVHCIQPTTVPMVHNTNSVNIKPGMVLYILWEYGIYCA